MHYKYILHVNAQKEFEDSYDWYYEKSEQIAENFIREVSDALQLICDHPERWRNISKNYHELNLKKYPFCIIHTIEKSLKTIAVTSIHHQKRNPKKKYKT